MEKQVRYRISWFLLLGALGLFLAGCGGSVNILEQQNDTELFEQGKHYYAQGDYEKALQYFLYVKEHFLRSSYAGLTRFYAGESYFALEEYPDAVIEYKSFLSFFPDDPNAVIAQYNLGVSYLKQALSPDRDQSMLQKALAELQNVKATYPDKQEYVAKAEQELRKTYKKIALHEFLVAKFYRKEKLYAAAVKRLEYLIAQYPEAGLTSDALFLLGQSHLDLDQPDEAQAPFLQILEFYPTSQHAEDARKKLVKLGVTTFPEPQPQVSAMQPVEAERPQPDAVSTPVPQSSLRGYVVLKRDNTVFTDLIRADGIQEGQILEVYRQGEQIGTIRIIEIQEGFSIGEIETITSKSIIQEEDLVVIP